MKKEKKGTIGHLIKKYRRAVGLTQKELGEASGYKEISIRQIEAEYYDPSHDKIPLIAKALNIPALYLLPDGIKTFDELEATLKDVQALSMSLEEDKKSLMLAKETGNTHEISKLQNKIHESSKALAEIESEKERYEKANLVESDSPLEYELNRIKYGFQPQNNIFGRKAKVLAAFDKLNEDGQNVAIDRVEELTEIPKYQKESI